MIKRGISALFCLSVTAALLLYPERYVKATTDSLLLWAECVLPSLFPFMVVSGLMTAINGKTSRSHRFLSPTSLTCLLLGLTSGYPTGARTVKDAYDRHCLTETECQNLSVLCTTSGPLFCIATVGYRLAGDQWAGGKLYLCHILSVLTIGLLFRRKGKTSDPPPLPRLKSENVLQDSMTNATTAVLTAGGYIAFFGTLSRIVCDFRLLYPLQALLSPLLGESASALCGGLVEMTGGCVALIALKTELSLPLCGFLITWGGVCVQAQQLGYLRPCGVKPLKWSCIKLLQALLCALLLWVWRQ